MKLDEAAKDLPASRIGSEWGRATSTIAKAVKAQLLLLAASLCLMEIRIILM